MENRPLVFTGVDSLGERIRSADRRATAQLAIYFSLQGIVISDPERSHRIDIAPAVRARADGRICIEQAASVSAAYGARIDVQPQGNAYAASSDVANVRHPASEVMLHRQIVPLRIPPAAGIVHRRRAHILVWTHRPITAAPARYQKFASVRAMA